MDTPVIKATTRKETGGSNGRKLRKEGFVPGVIYGHKSQTKNIQIEFKDIASFISRYGTKTRFDLEIDGNKTSAFFKNIQRDVITKFPIHADLQELYANETVKMKIPLNFINTDSIQNSILHFDLSEIQIEALPKNMPESIEVDVSKYKLGDTLLVKDLDIDRESISIQDDEESTVFSIKEAREMQVESDDDDEMTTPEVIGESAE